MTVYCCERGLDYVILNAARRILTSVHLRPDVELALSANDTSTCNFQVLLRGVERQNSQYLSVKSAHLSWMIALSSLGPHHKVDIHVSLRLEQKHQIVNLIRSVEIEE